MESRKVPVGKKIHKKKNIVDTEIDQSNGFSDENFQEINDTHADNDEDTYDKDEITSDEDNEALDLDEPAFNEDEAASVQDESASDEDEAVKHKRDLEKLKESDPDFYKFLQDNDKKLLQFNLSDDDDDETESIDDLHKPVENLEVASDESDFEVSLKCFVVFFNVITAIIIGWWYRETKRWKGHNTKNAEKLATTNSYG